MLKPIFDAGSMFKTSTNMLALLAFALIVPSLSFAIEREISWTEDYEAAVQRAATTNSIVLLHFYGDSCPPCKLLDKKTFHDPALVSKMNEHLVPVKINADRRRDLAQKFQVTRWPTDIYLFPNGDEIYRGVSNADPSVYCKTIERVALRHRDWTVERNSTARAKEKRQDRAIAAHTPQIQAEHPAYAGNAGHSVKTQAAAWTNQAFAPKQNLPSSAMPGASSQGTRVIENPYITQQPIIVPPAPSNPSNDSIPPIVHAGLSSPEPAPIMAAAPVVARPISSQRSPTPTLNPSPTPTLNVYPEPQLPVQATPQQPNTFQSQSDPIASQRVVADTIGMGGYCPVALIESLDNPQLNGWVEGKPTCAVRHRGRVYYCASERARQTLLSDPDRYTPCLSGYDIVHLCRVGKLRDGKCEFGCIQEGTNRVFLFDTKANFDEFTQNSVYYSRLLDNAAPERVANELNGTQKR